MTNMFRDNLYDNFPDPNKKIEEVDAQVSKVKGDMSTRGINAMYPPDGLTAMKCDYNYDTQTGTDDTEALQSLIDYASVLGLKITIPKPCLILGNIDIKEGVKLEGVNWQVSKKETGTNRRKFKGSVLILRGAQFTLRASSSVKDFTIFYDQQKYFLNADVTKPDGLEDFTDYPATFLVNSGNGGGFSLENINYFGGSTIVDQVDNDSTQRFYINNINGFATKTGFIFKKALDVSNVNNVNLNMSGYWGLDPLARPNHSDVARKIAKNFTAFKLGRVDELIFNNCLIFGAREFVWLYNHPDGGASASFVSCTGDVVHTAVRNESNGGVFGVTLANSKFTPIMQNVVIDGAVTTKTPALVRTAAVANNTRIMLSNVRTFGTNANTFTGDTAKCVNPYQIEATTTSNKVFVTGGSHSDYTGGLVTGANDKNKVSLSNVELSDGSLSNKVYGEQWVNFTLQNGAAAYDATPIARYKEEKGVVKIRMRVKNMTIGSPLATLPSTLKPDYNRALLCATSTNSNAKVNISSVDGTITVSSADVVADAQTLTYIEYEFEKQQS